MYNQLQQKFKDAQLFEQMMPVETTQLAERQNAPMTSISEQTENSHDGPSVEILPDDSLELILILTGRIPF